MILILGTHEDPQIAEVRRCLTARGAAHVCFDPEQFPSRADIVVSCNPDGLCAGTLRSGQGVVRLSQVTTVWYRTSAGARADGRVRDPQQRAWIERESDRVLHSALALLDARWIAACPADIARAEDPCIHRRHASRAGFRVPATLITNSPADFLSFIDESPDTIVGKVVADQRVRNHNESRVARAHRIGRRDVRWYPSVRLAPVLCEQRIDSRLLVRVTVVDGDVFASARAPVLNGRDVENGRTAGAGADSFSPHDVPPEVAERVVRLVAGLGLSYGEIDLILTPDGEYVFLGVRWRGELGRVDPGTRRLISDALGALLVRDETTPRTTTAEHSSGWAV